MGLLVLREAFPYVRQGPAGLVIETGRSVAHLAAKIGVGEIMAAPLCFLITVELRRPSTRRVDRSSAC